MPGSHLQGRITPRRAGLENLANKFPRRLTFFDDEERHDERHGVAGVDVVAAVDVLLVDGEAGAGEQLEHALQDHQDLSEDGGKRHN